jgi:tetratricopeptide (TPR) repeat protein
MFKAATAVMAIGAVAAWGQAPAQAPKKQVDRASAYYHYTLAHMYAELAGAYGTRNDYINKAIDNYKEAIKADPETPMLSEELSELYIASGRMREAQNDAEEALRQNPNDVAARRLLARIFTRQIGDSQQNRIDEAMLRRAIEQYQKITELDPKDMDSLVMLGRLQKVAQNSVEAEKAFKRVLASEPDNEDALTGLAMVYADLGNTTEAADLLKKLAEKNPSPKSLRALASAYEQMKEFTLAAETLNRALALNPPDAADLKREMARNRAFAKDYAAALKIYQELVEEEPGDADSHLQISRIYLQQHDYAKAREAGEKARNIEPGNLDIRYNEVVILEAEGRVTDAIAKLKEILSGTTRRNYNQEDRNNRIELLSRLAALYRSADQPDQAVDTLRQIVDLAPEDGAKVSVEIIQTYTLGKEYAKAEQEAEAAVKKWPSDRLIHTQHAILLADMGKVDQGAAEIKKLFDGKNDREVYMALAEVYDKGKRFDEMNRALDEAEKRSTTKEEKMEVWFSRGAMYEKMKKPDPSEAEFRKILDVNPNHAGALNYLGYMLADRNVRLQESLQLITKALELEPGNGAYLDSLGWVYFKMGRLPEAEENLRKAIELTPRDATVHDHMGDILMKESKVREAIAQWETSLKEWNSGSPADLEPSEVAKVKSKLEGAKVRLAKENSPKQ